MTCTAENNLLTILRKMVEPTNSHNVNEDRKRKSFSQRTKEEGWIQHEEFKREFIRRLESHFKEDKICSGIKEFDDAIGGYIPGQFIVIAGFPIMGICDFLISLIVGLGINHSIPMAFLSLEMVTLQVVKKILMNFFELTREELVQEESNIRYEKIEQLNNASIFIDDTPALTIDMLKAKVISYSSIEHVKVFMLDNLQLIKNYDENPTQILQEIKQLAEENQITIIALSWLKRTFKRDFPIFLNSNYQCIETIMQYADTVAVLNRSAYYCRTIAKVLPDLSVMYFLKNINSGVSTIELSYTPQICKFTQYSED